MPKCGSVRHVGVPHSSKIGSTEFEYLYVFWKPGVTKIDRTRLTPDEWREWGSRGVWYIPSVRANDDHEAKFPPELPRRFIQLLTEPGEIVLDCFMGSGTTAVAAIQQRRQFIGIELLEEYVKLAQINIQKTSMAQQPSKLTFISSPLDGLSIAPMLCESSVS